MIWYTILICFCIKMTEFTAVFVGEEDGYVNIKEEDGSVDNKEEYGSVDIKEEDGSVDIKEGDEEEKDPWITTSQSTQGRGVIENG